MKVLQSEFTRDSLAILAPILGAHVMDRPSEEFLAKNHSALWSELTGGGWQFVGVPEKSGGAGFDLVDLAALAEVWGRHLFPLPFIPSVLIWRWRGHADEEIGAQQLSFALPSTDGRGAISPFAGSKTVQIAANVDDISEQVVEVTAERTSESDRASQAMAWSPSLPLRRLSQPTHGIPPEGCHEVAVLGVAELVGTASSALQLSTQYARDRVQFGQPIADFQAVQHHLANMVRDVEMARTAVVAAANDGTPDTAVVLAWDMTRRVVETAIQVHGGIGFTWEGGLHYHLRHVWSWAELFRAIGIDLWT